MHTEVMPPGVRLKILHTADRETEDFIHGVYMEVPELEQFGFLCAHRIGFTVETLPISKLLLVDIWWFGPDYPDQHITEWEFHCTGKSEVFNEDTCLNEINNFIIAEYLKSSNVVPMRHDYFSTKYDMSDEDRGALALLLGQIEPVLEIEHKIVPQKIPNHKNQAFTESTNVI